MDKADISLILEIAQSYLLYEKDLRSHDPEKGWVNATANVTGLLRYLAMHELIDNGAIAGYSGDCFTETFSID